MVLLSHQTCALSTEEVDIDEKEARTEEVVHFFRQQELSEEKEASFLTKATFNAAYIEELNLNLDTTFIVSCYFKLFILFLTLIIFFNDLTSSLISLF